jgi:hypothetical protein
MQDSGISSIDKCRVMAVDMQDAYMQLAGQQATA